MWPSCATDDHIFKGLYTLSQYTCTSMFITPCPTWLSMTLSRHRTSHHGEGLISSYSLQYSIKGNQGSNWRQERKQRCWRNTAYCLDPHGLFNFLRAPRTTSPGMALPTVGWSQKCPPVWLLGHTDVDIFSTASNLCHIDKIKQTEN